MVGTNNKQIIRRLGVLLAILAGSAIFVCNLVAAPSSALAGVPARSGPAAKSQPAAPSACQWSIVASPDPAPFSGLGDIKAISANDIWAVGSYKTTAPFSIKNLAEHWDGSTWTRVPTPNVDPSGGPYMVNQLFAVDGIASNDVWAVGKVLYGAQTLHWDGTQWNDVPLSNFNSIGDLRSVKMLSHNDVWAVSVIQASPTRTAIIHWDGTQWNTVYTSSDFTRPMGLYSLTVVSPTDMWAAGSIVMHWNGTQWSEVTGVMPIYTIYYAIHALSANDIWAVGGDGSQHNVTVHYDGTSWTLITSPNPDAEGWLLGVSGLASNDVWAVGHSQPSGSSYGEGQAMHWNGAAWTVATVQTRDENGELDAIALLPSGEKWAVGYSNLHDGVTQHTLVERYTCDSGATATPTVAVATPTVGVATATATPCGSFSDVLPGSTFYPYITCLVNQGVMSGYDDCTFRPNSNITRGQLAKIVSNAAGFSETIPDTQQTFEDVLHSNPFWLWIERLAGRGIIGGYDCGGPGEPCVPPGNRKYFRWSAHVTRGQASKIIAIGAGITDPVPQTQQTFEDVPHSNPFWLWIEQLSGRGVMAGYPCGIAVGEPCQPGNRPYFRWASNIRRGQASKIVSRTFLPDCQARQ